MVGRPLKGRRHREGCVGERLTWAGETCFVKPLAWSASSRNAGETPMSSPKNTVRIELAFQGSDLAEHRFHRHRVPQRVQCSRPKVEGGSYSVPCSTPCGSGLKCRSCTPQQSERDAGLVRTRTHSWRKRLRPLQPFANYSSTTASSSSVAGAAGPGFQKDTLLHRFK